MTTLGTNGIEAAPRIQTIRDTFHRLAASVGLTHTGGQAQYSEFSGTRAQWLALADVVRERAHLYSAASVRAVLSRIDWAAS